MKKKAASSPIEMSIVNLLKLFITKLFIIIILVILTKNVRAQGCSIILKIHDPSPICSPLTIDLTNAAITTGSTSDLIFSYYLNPELTIPAPSPTKANSGIYYIKGVLTDNCAGFVAASVKVTVNEIPKLIIPNPVVTSINGNVDLTLPQVTSGSEEGLVFSYWYDSEAKNPLPSPKLTGKGEYFIKGTSADGCFDNQPITVINN